MLPPVTTQSTLSLSRRRVRTAWLYLLPMLVVLVAVAAWPLGRTFWFSITDANFSAIDEASFIGLDNYLYLLSDETWWQAFRNTVFFAALSVSLETILGMIIALALHRRFAGRGLLRAAVLIPWAIPTVVSAQLWNWMFHDVFGIVNEVLMSVGILSAPVAWTANPDTALWAIIAVDVWKTTPFMTLLLLAGLQLLPQECYEAARIDGVSPIKVFFRVTLPLIRPALLVAVIFRVLDALRVFDVIYVMTGNNDNTMSLSVYARQQLIDFQDVGLGSAASSLLFGFIALFAILYMAFARIGKES